VFIVPDLSMYVRTDSRFSSDIRGTETTRNVVRLHCPLATKSPSSAVSEFGDDGVQHSPICSHFSDYGLSFVASYICRGMSNEICQFWGKTCHGRVEYLIALPSDRYRCLGTIDSVNGSCERNLAARLCYNCSPLMDDRRLL
jgi:hypothetical protein